jgi:hypothetical protein
MALRPSDFPLVRGGKLTPEMLAWLERVAEYFPGVEKGVVTIRKPIPPSPRGVGKVSTRARQEQT